jgi:hypothetical protein
MKKKMGYKRLYKFLKPLIQMGQTRFTNATFPERGNINPIKEGL